MLLVLLILTSVTVTMVRTAFDNQSASRTAAAKAQARLYAAAALEEFYARVSTDEGFLRDVLAFDLLTGSLPHPGLRAPGGNYVAGDGTDNGPWALLSMPSGWRGDQQVVPTGSTACPTGQEGLFSDCYYVTVYGDGSTGGLPGVVVVEVTLRTRCAGEEPRCTFTRFQQRLRRTQFFEFALAQELATLAPEALFPAGSFDDASDPNRSAFLKYRSACGSKRGLVRSGVVLNELMVLGRTTTGSGQFVTDASTLEVSNCVDMAYHSDASTADPDRADTLSGPLYTADDFITICGTPRIEAVYVSGRGWDNDGDGAREAHRESSSISCVGSDLVSSRSETRVPMLLQPPALGVLTDAEGAPSAEVLEKVDPNTASTAEFLGTTVRFTNVRLRSGEDCASSGPSRLTCPVDKQVFVLRTPVSSTGSDYASTDLHVSGNITGMVSLVVEGSAAIVDDLVYNGGGAVSNQQDALTLTATERIEIWQGCAQDDPSPRSDACTDAHEDRVVHGILTSSLGYVGVPDWQYNTEDGRAQRKLTFFGSIASRYQGVYGAYVEAGAADRRLVSGFYKDFGHDNLSRIITDDPSKDTIEEQLPFFVQTETAVWNRVDITEVPYRP